MSRVPTLLLLSLVVLNLASAQESPRKAADAPSTEGVAFFEKKIRPVLVAECFECHSTEKGKKVRGGLALDTRDGVRKGGDTGPALVPGNPARSLLIKALSHGDKKLAMPPMKKMMPPSSAISRSGYAWARPTRATGRRSHPSTSTSNRAASTGRISRRSGRPLRTSPGPIGRAPMSIASCWPRWKRRG